MDGKNLLLTPKYNIAWLQEQAVGSVKPGSVWSGWYDPIGYGKLLYGKHLFTLTIQTLEVIELYGT